jgi:hypothetical protein
MIAAFLLQPGRALVITPSQLVRDQIQEQFANLQVLKELGVLPEGFAAPRVFEVKGLLASREAWEALRDYDLVVATPNSASPAIDGVATPPG